MSHIFFAAREAVTAAVVLVPILLLLNQVLFHNFRKSICFCIFSFYLAAVYALVGLPSITYVRFEINLNLLPVVGIAGDLKNSILNVFLFVPLGIMLPMMWEKYRARKNTVLFGFGMSLAIELLQIFTLRATDINDLLTNVVGTFLGFLLAQGLMKGFPETKNPAGEAKTGELYGLCGLTFAVMFLIQPFLSSVF